MNNYIVVGQHPWNKRIFQEHLQYLPGEWYYCDTVAQYKSAATLYPPRFIFFLHWSRIVPDWFVNKYECVCFHPTDLPFGRGGTPIQNLIEKGYKHTTVTAFRMTEELDAGPVYYKAALSLSGSAREIFNREMNVVAQMINYIIQNEPVPEEQTGEAEYFTRRTPEMSEIKSSFSIEQFYDHVRMLDAPGYPAAFIPMENVILEIKNVQRIGDALQGSISIRNRQ